jgi:hypothetical protein
VLGVVYPTERRQTMRHPDILYAMAKEHQANLMHEADAARAVKDLKKAAGSRSVIGNLRVFLTSFL